MLHKYLRAQISSAVKNSCPDFELTDDTIDFFYKPTTTSCISTPYIFTIAKNLHTPPTHLALTIMAEFNWDTYFVIPDFDLNRTVNCGFLNFSISPLYLIDKLKSSIVTNSSPREFLTTNLPFGISKSIENGISFLSHTVIPENAYSTDLWSKLSDTIERTLLNLIAISEPSELHSPDAALFFLRIFCTAIDHYLKKLPVFSKDKQITAARISLTYAVYNRIITLCRIYSGNDF